jgi:enoyl-CoA hydratase/carnithine racemase
VTLSVEDGIATVTLNRPDSLNALSQEVMRSLERQVDVIGQLSEIRVVLITGAGRAFSAGGNLLEFEDMLATDKMMLLAQLRYNQDIFGKIEDLSMPVIGVANGVAVAGGLELLLCCDMILASEDAKIGDGHTRYGVMPAGGATVRLEEWISPPRAAQLFYTASLYNAAVLRDWGLVNEVVSADHLMDRAVELAREIAERSPEAIRHIKALRRQGRPQSRDLRLRAELDHFAQHVNGADFAIGLSAFRNRLSPRFRSPQ